MNNMIIELARYRMEKAKNDLKASKIMLENNLFSQSLNRSYYSIFHSVRAVLAFEQFDSKKHSGIIAYFNQNFIKKGVFSKHYSKILMGAEKIRNKSDYNDFYIASKEDAVEQVRNAEEFVRVVDEYIKNMCKQSK